MVLAVSVLTFCKHRRKVASQSQCERVNGESLQIPYESNSFMIVSSYFRCNYLATLSVRQVIGAIVVITTAHILLNVVSQVGEIGRDMTRSAPFRSGINEPALVGGMYLVVSANIDQFRDRFVRHLTYAARIGAEKHAANATPET